MFENWRSLTSKNLKLFFRNRKYSMFFFLTPICIIIFMQLFQHIFDQHMLQNLLVDTPIEPITNVPKCIYPQDCISIGYSVIGQKEDWIDKVMKIVAESNGLEFQKDVKQITQGNAQDFKNYIRLNQNKTQVAVVFCTDTWDLNIPNYNATFPCKFDKIHDKK